MKRTADQTRTACDPEAEWVALWLRAHPDFLAHRPELYRHLDPPRRVHGEALADHMQARIEAGHADLARAERALADAALAGRAGAALVLAVRRAVLALMRTADPVECVSQEFPALLGLACAAILAEPMARIGLPMGIRAVPAGSVARLLGPGRDALVRAAPSDPAMLHGEAAPLVARDALVRVTLPGGAPALLVLGAREPAALPSRQSAATLEFLGRAVTAALASRS